MRNLPFLIAAARVFAAVFVVSFVTPAAEARTQVEAVDGKEYTLTKEHGPWMIMVTSLWGETRKEFDEAKKAANKLVFELRKKGIPAYTYAQDSQLERVTTTDRFGREQRRVYAAQRGMIGILAGNYKTVDHADTQNSLKFVKAFRPRVLTDAGYAGTKGGPGPLVKAFLTINPLLKPEDIAVKTRDPLLTRLNSGSEFSLFDNRHKHTVIVASFYGKSEVKPARFAEFDQMLRKDGATLDNAAMECWQLVKAMRAQGIEAFVYHDRTRSIVTVGGFDSPNDPGIARLIEAFRAKYVKNPDNGQDVLVAESIQIPGKKPGDPPLKSWVMDPVPELIDVPRLK